jgi:hypothetical protein
MPTKHVLAVCPVCEQNFIFNVDVDFFSNTQNNFPVPLLVKHCNNSLIVYVDNDYKCRGAEQVHAILDERHVIENNEEIQANVIDSDFINKMAPDEKIVLSCGRSCEQILQEKFPNVIDKQVLLKISKYREISLAILISELKSLEKALNRIFDRDSVLKIVDRYVQKGFINKQLLEFSEDIEKIAHEHKVNTPQTEY